MTWTISQQTLFADGLTLLRDLPNGATVRPYVRAAILSLPASEPRLHWKDTPLGAPVELDRALALYHTDSGALRLWAGDGKSLPAGTFPFALFLRTDGLFLLLAALPTPQADARIRALAGTRINTATLVGNRALDNVRLALRLDTAAPSVAVDGAASLIIAVGEDVRRLCADAAAILCNELRRPRLRFRKAEPAFSRRLGWSVYACTTAKEVEHMFDAYAEHRLPAGALWLDLLWETLVTTDSEFHELRSLTADATRFPDGLEPLIRRARAIGFRSIIARRHLFGAPGGINPDALPAFKPRDTFPPLSPDCLDGMRAPAPEPPEAPELPPPRVRIPTAAAWRRFQREADAAVHALGADGVQLEGFAALPFVVADRDGIIPAGSDILNAAEDSLHRTFGTEFVLDGLLPPLSLLSRRASLITCRLASGKSPGEKLRAQTTAALWLGQFHQRAADPFSLQDPLAAWQAAGCALSGGPIRFCGTPTAESRELLSHLAFPDGTIPLFHAPATPALTSLFPDPAPQPADVPPHAFVALNTVPRLQSGVAGVFDLAPEQPVFPNGGAQAFVSPAELPAANARRYAAWTHNGRELTLLNRRDVLSIRTGSARFEIVTFAPVQRDAYAILGIVSLWAAAASVLQIEETPSGVTVSLAGPGEFAAAFMDRPKEVRCNGKPLSFVWVEESGLLLARLPDVPSPTVSIRF